MLGYQTFKNSQAFAKQVRDSLQKIHKKTGAISGSGFLVAALLMVIQLLTGAITATTTGVDPTPATAGPKHSGATTAQDFPAKRGQCRRDQQGSS
jgi:hypothetical protein